MDKGGLGEKTGISFKKELKGSWSTGHQRCDGKRESVGYSKVKDYWRDKYDKVRRILVLNL